MKIKSYYLTYVVVVFTPLVVFVTPLFVVPQLLLLGVQIALYIIELKGSDK